jgi:curli biogenesis system outer membrane secretion channel CsgG
MCRAGLAPPMGEPKMKTICVLLAITVIFYGSVSSADVNNPPKDTIIKEVKGQGATRDDAIKNALFTAVAQAKGVKVGSGDYSFGFQSASADINRTGTGKQVGFDAVSVQTAGTLQTTDIAGLVKTYEVIDEKELSDGLYQVKIKAWILDHQPLDKGARVRLAVMPVRTEAKSYSFLDLVMPADKLADILAQKLTTLLTQTNKFAVLDRQHIAEYLHEQSVLFYSAPIEEQARIGQSLGADLMLVGTVTEANLRIKLSENPGIAHTYKEYRADFAFDFRLIVASSRQVKISDSIRLRLETADVKKLVQRWEPSDLDLNELADNLIAQAALEVVNKISNQMYPPRIAEIRPNSYVIIDQGGDRLTAGMLLEVVKSDKPIIDSDTKESLGSPEIPVAVLKLVTVTPSMSYATIVSGEVSQLSQGMICRIKSVPAEEPQGAKSTVERTEQGGVNLPFDN